MAVTTVNASSDVSSIISSLKSKSDLSSEDIKKAEETLKEEYEKKAAQMKAAALSGSSSASTSSVYTALESSASNVSDGLRSIQEALSKGDLSSAREGITSFVSAYNTMLSNLSKAGSAECSAMLKAFRKYAKDNEELLSTAGVTINGEKLSLDADALDEADEEALEKAFGASSPFATEVSKLSASAVTVASMRTSSLNALGTTYGGSATYLQAKMSQSVLDAFS